LQEYLLANKIRKISTFKFFVLKNLKILLEFSFKDSKLK